MQKPAARAAFARPKKLVVHGFPETLKIIGKINVSRTAPVHEFHVGRPGQRKIQPPTVKNLRKTATPPLPNPAVDSSCSNWCTVSLKPLDSLGNSMILNVELVWLGRTANWSTCDAQSRPAEFLRKTCFPLMVALHHNPDRARGLRW